MSVEQLEAQVERLPHQDLARLVGWLDHFLDRQSPSNPAEPADLTNDEQAELLRRRDEVLANPHLVQPMDDTYFDGLKRQLADACALKASGRRCRDQSRRRLVRRTVPRLGGINSLTPCGPMARSVQQTLLRFAIRFADLRRANLTRFPYAVWFFLSNHGVFILAVLHHKRDHRAMLEQRRGST